MAYKSPFEDFTFIENCKIHNIPLVKYSWGEQCPMCIAREYLFWEGSTEPFIHRDCVSPALAQNVNDFSYTMKSYAQLQPRETILEKMRRIDDFIRLMRSNDVTLHKYNDVYSQSPREGYLILSRKSGKIISTITIEKNPNDVKRSFI
jgi:hypothetical protein